jgi:thioredoxin reductase (NADPH)
MSEIDYDAIIIGGGPGGLTAGLYLARAGKRTLCLEQGAMGGQLAATSFIENYPGFPDGISGKELTESFETHARRFGLEIMSGRVDGLKVDGEVKEVSVGGFPFRSLVVIIATGLIQKLGVPGEEEYLGRGLSYCATCDGALFRNREAALVGTTDHAIEEALFVAGFASKLYVITKSLKIVPKNELRKSLLAAENIEIVYGASPVEITGDAQGVTGVKVTLKDDGERSLAVDGVFVCAGKRIPGTGFAEGLIELTEKGFAVVGENCETNVEGIYAIGDVRRSRFWQVATAVGDGAVAAMDAMRHLRSAKAK